VCPSGVDEDLDQDFELEKLEAAREGRPPRKKKWLAIDKLRKELGRGKMGPRNIVPILPEELAQAPEPETDQWSRNLADRATRMAQSLPQEQRHVIVMALRCLSHRTAEGKVRVWLELNPNRRATHKVIAEEVGLSRFSVTRALVKLRRKTK
jgi:hypothetical protein